MQTGYEKEIHRKGQQGLQNPQEGEGVNACVSNGDTYEGLRVLSTGKRRAQQRKIELLTLTGFR